MLLGLVKLNPGERDGSRCMKKRIGNFGQSMAKKGRICFFFRMEEGPQTFRISTTVRIFLPAAHCRLIASTGMVLHPIAPSLLQQKRIIMNLVIFNSYEKEMKGTCRFDFAILCSPGILEDSILRRADKKVLFELIMFPFHF